MKVIWEALTLSPSWPVVGLLLILIGAFVKFEVKVVDPGDKNEIKSQKEMK